MKRNIDFSLMFYKKRVDSLFFSSQGIVQKQLLGILLFSSLIVLSGCGGGGGVYYPPAIAMNTIDLNKVELSQTGITSYERQFFPVSYYDNQLEERQVEKGRKIFDTYGYFQEVEFLGNEYYLHSNSFFMGVDVIRKSDMKKILYLMTPRSVFLFSSFPVTMKNRNFLVIYISQRSTSHSSTFFVVDSEFKTVYQEHLLGAEEIGYTHSDKYGNCIVLKSENFWFPNGTDKPRVTINGDWVYYIPDETTKEK